MTMNEANSRPYLEDQFAEYEVMLKEIRDAIQAEFPGGTWVAKDKNEIQSTGYVVKGGYIAYSHLWTYDISVSESEEDKERAFSVLAPIAKKYGFSEPGRYVDQGNNTQYISDDQYGAELKFGSMVNTVLRITTGVHLMRNPGGPLPQ